MAGVRVEDGQILLAGVSHVPEIAPHLDVAEAAVGLHLGTQVADVLGTRRRTILVARDDRVVVVLNPHPERISALRKDVLRLDDRE